jgi:hypothetical protein
MLARALAAGAPFAWVAADAVYGQHPGLREWCEAKSLRYAMAVPSRFKVTAVGRGQHDTPRPADSPAQRGAEGEDDSINDLDDVPDDDTHPAPSTGFGLDDAYEEADKW